MHCTRRDLLRMTALTATATAIGRHAAFGQTAAGQAPAAPAPAAAPPAPPVPAFTKLRRNIGIFTGQGGTIGYLINPGGVAIIDTQYPVTAKVCLEGIKSRAPKRAIDVVINTHHHADHTGGNGIFRESAKKIVAHANVPRYQKEAAAVQPPNPNAPPEPTFPDTTFPDRWRVELGDEVISAWHYGPAHTGGDVIVLFEEANVAHLGDLLFNRMAPFIDRARGGSIASWMTLLETVMKEDPPDRLYIFGHASPKFQVTGSRADLALQRDYFTALLEYTRAKVKAGTPREEFITSKDVLKGFEDHGPLFDRALGAAFDEVSAGK
jgi:cyclase